LRETWLEGIGLWSETLSFPPVDERQGENRVPSAELVRVRSGSIHKSPYDACNIMQDCTIRFSIPTKVGGTVVRFSGVTVPAVAMVLLMSGSAVQTRSKIPFVPHSPAEAQRSLGEQKPSIAIPWPPPRPPDAPPRPRDTAKLPGSDERAFEQGSQEAAAVLTRSPCQVRLTPDLAAVEALSPISSGQCAAEDVVRVDAVVVRDGRRIAITPPATLRCPMAESVIHWVRDELTSIAAEFGAPLRSLMVDTSYECRSRNHVVSAKLSEHGRANAVDLRGFTLADGAVVELTDRAVKKEARERLRETACKRFTTVLGPGSDSYHENHVHLDLVERRSGYRICQWDVRDPNVIGAVPLPPYRPASAPARSTTGIRSAGD
jgi:hypothetical protein